jgi:adenine-specific DNA-methyltransferase
LFPNAVTETIDENGVVVRAIDADVLRQEINTHVVEGREERYQFTWPDKRKSILLANAPIAADQRPCREESVDFDTTENLYIEGDNLDVLKLLRETYLNRVKMIYIDPPYNTGHDFVYEDDFADETGSFLRRDGQYDEQGNRLTPNLDSNGRFHTDWLNMIYPRLRIARDLLREDGVIFISVDYNENYNCRKLLDEIFGSQNFVGEIYWESKTKSQNTSTAYNKLQPKAEMIFVYTKSDGRRFNLISKGGKDYPFSDEQGVYREYPLEVMNASGIRGRESMIYPVSDGVSTVSPPAGKQWKLGQAQVATFNAEGNLFIREGKAIIKMRPDFERGESTEPFWGFFSKDMGTAESAKKELTGILGQHGFETVKPVEVIKRLVLHATSSGDIILDFFSGSATTAHAVMQLNAEDGGKRKFIMVQLPEVCAEGTEAAKAGYKNICEIGKERIRRAGQKIKADNAQTTIGGGNIDDLDIGFRVLKLDSSNMKEVYYTPQEYAEQQFTFDGLVDNIKSDRTAEDLLFQVMLDLGIPLSAKIEVKTIEDKTVYSVNDGYLLACFEGVTDALVTAIAKSTPYYAVFRDSSFVSDSTLVNYEQIFKTHSPTTQRRVL